jgi:hypothetical protein
MADSWAW